MCCYLVLQPCTQYELVAPPIQLLCVWLFSAVSGHMSTSTTEHHICPCRWLSLAEDLQLESMKHTCLQWARSLPVAEFMAAQGSGRLNEDLMRLSISLCTQLREAGYALPGADEAAAPVDLERGPLPSFDDMLEEGHSCMLQCSDGQVCAHHLQSPAMPVGPATTCLLPARCLPMRSCCQWCRFSCAGSC